VGCAHILLAPGFVRQEEKARFAENIRGAAMRVLNLSRRRFGELNRYNETREFDQ